MYREAVVKSRESGASTEKRLSVEVIYLEKGSYKSRRFFIYPAGEAERVYRATLQKFKKEKTPALVMIRDGAGDILLSSERTG